MTDEVSGTSGFFDPDDRNLYSWPSQEGATRYQVARGSSADFAVGCQLLHPTPQTSMSLVDDPLPGEVLHYLVRALLPNTGSWGQDSAGAERDLPCD